MQWIRTRLKDNTSLKVIFVHQVDPNDNPENPSDDLRRTFTAVNVFLPSSKEVNSRIAFYRRKGPGVVHSKTWIIDDKFAIIGSANFMRRSFYTDVELSISITDNDLSDDNFIKRYRRELWAEWCENSFEEHTINDLKDINMALAIWDESWIPIGILLLFLGSLHSIVHFLSKNGSFYGKYLTPYRNRV